MGGMGVSTVQEGGGAGWVQLCGFKARGTQDHHSVLKGEPQTQVGPLGRWVSRCGGSEGLAGLEGALK